MASQKFTKVTLFFNCKLLYGGENKIFASKSELVSKLTQISDGTKEISFINGRTVPFSKEFSMHFKWEEFPTYRNNPFNYPNYAVFTDGTINRTFGYFVTSSNTKNLPSDTVELFFKYDSFINNSDVIKNLKNKKLDRLTVDGFIKKPAYILYNDYSDTTFIPTVYKYEGSLLNSSDYFSIKYLPSISNVPQTLQRASRIIPVFLKYILDETALIETQNNLDITFPDLSPLKVLYIPFCFIDLYGNVVLDYNIKFIRKNTVTNNYIDLTDSIKPLYNIIYSGMNDKVELLKYLDSKAVFKCLTCECTDLFCYVEQKENSDTLLVITENYIKIDKVNSINANYFCFMNYRFNDIKYNIPNSYSLSSYDISIIDSMDDDIEKIKKSIGALNIYPYNYYSINIQGVDTKLVPVYNEENDINSDSHFITSSGNKNNTYIFFYRAIDGEYPYKLSFKSPSQLPISKNALEMYLQTSSNQILNNISYASKMSDLNSLSHGAKLATSAVGALAGIIELDASAVSQSIDSGIQAGINLKKEEVNLNRIIDENKAKQEDLKNTNSNVSIGDLNSVNKIIIENVPMLFNYKYAYSNEINGIALFFNKYGINYNNILQNVFTQYHENFDFYKLSEFDEQEIDIQPNDERKDVYNILIDGVRIWHNIEKFGTENKYNKPLSFNI